MSGTGIFLLLVGVGLGVGGLIAGTRTQKFVASAVKGQAQVSRLSSRRSGKGRPVYFPVLRFKTEAGTEHEVVSSVGSSPPSYTAGDTVPILYNPARPEEVRIHSFFYVWMLTIVLGGVAAVFLSVGGVLVVTGR